MSEPFIAKIVIFAGNFAPRSWSYCDGQLIAVSSNSALFSLLGTIYGGDGRTTFGLPDLRGRVAMHAGNGPGLQPARLGQKTGTERNTMTVQTMPSHTHAATTTLKASTQAGGVANPSGQYPAADSAGELSYQTAAGANETLAANPISATVGLTGGSQPYNNIGPVQAINYIIAIYGVYPSRH